MRSNKRNINEPPHDKTKKMIMCPAKTQISLRICPVWSESMLSARRKLGSLATHWAHSEDSNQTGQMPRLIWIFAGWQSFCWFCQKAAQMSWGTWKLIKCHVHWANFYISLLIHAVFYGSSLSPQGPKAFSCKQQRLWAYCADVQAGLSSVYAYVAVGNAPAQMTMVQSSILWACIKISENYGEMLVGQYRG